MQATNTPDTYLDPMPDGVHVIAWWKEEMSRHFAELWARPGFLNKMVSGLISTRLFETFFRWSQVISRYPLD